MFSVSTESESSPVMKSNSFLGESLSSAVSSLSEPNMSRPPAPPPSVSSCGPYHDRLTDAGFVSMDTRFFSKPSFNLAVNFDNVCLPGSWLHAGFYLRGFFNTSGLLPPSVSPFVKSRTADQFASPSLAFSGSRTLPVSIASL